MEVRSESSFTTSFGLMPFECTSSSPDLRGLVGLVLGRKESSSPILGAGGAPLATHILPLAAWNAFAGSGAASSLVSISFGHGGGAGAFGFPSTLGRSTTRQVQLSSLRRATAVHTIAWLMPDRGATGDSLLAVDTHSETTSCEDIKP